MGWLRKKCKNIESKIDKIGEGFEGTVKQEKQEREKETKKRQWKNLNWYQKLAGITIFIFCIIFLVVVGPPLWKLLCKLWQLFMGYCIWKQATG